MSRKPQSDSEKLADPRRAFIKTIGELSHTKRTWEVFRDFCEMSAITLSNAVDWSPRRDDREKRYLQVAGTYKPDELKRFPFLLACVVEALELKYDDVLGSLFMELELGNHWKGQFFTPYCIAAMMGKMVFDPEHMSEHEFITVQEPAAGACGMIIGFAEAMHAAQINPQERLHVTAVDVDIMCVHMSYIQLTLYNLPALVIHGNTLSLDEWSHWYTPAHVLGMWDAKLRRHRRQAAGEPVIETVMPLSPVKGISPAHAYELAHALMIENTPESAPDQSSNDGIVTDTISHDDRVQLALF